MNFYIINHDYKYESERVARLFLPLKKFCFIYDETPDFEGDYIYTSAEKNGKETVLKAEVRVNGKKAVKTDGVFNNIPDFKSAAERKLTTLLFLCFEEITEYSPEWGMLTGIRPARFLSNLIKRYGKEKALRFLTDEMFVKEKKKSLCYDCLLAEEKIISHSKPDFFSLYISVPFCPSRCKYCSFVSHSVKSSANLIPLYVEKVCEEIRYTARIAKECGLKLCTVYIGGGTPTTLSAEQLQKIMQTVNGSFDKKHLAEFTVEAGRPDTITEEKLRVILNNGATRISINPQTMNDEVLKIAGRPHTAKDFVDSFLSARKVGFNNINTDLIAGLSGDSFESFKHTVDEIVKLSPESVTVHSLSVKRAADIDQFDSLANGNETEKMVSYAQKTLTDNNLFPYYLYRQGKTVGNLENVGYAKKGRECLYNIYIMDETHTVLACGAAATSKLRQPNGEYIERIFNYKYPYEYLNKFDEMLKRKERVKEFYDIYGATDKQKG